MPKPRSSERGAVAEAWIPASQVHKAVSLRVPYGHATETICRLAREGVLKARAKRFRSNGVESLEVDLHPDFWSGVGAPNMHEDWSAGVLESLIDDDLNSELATGIRFRRDDVENYLGSAELGSQGTPETQTGDTAETQGRRRSAAWFEWIAEAVATLHERGMPDGHGSEGQREFIRRIDEGLAKRGIDGPARTTVLPAVVAILRRLRAGPHGQSAAKMPRPNTRTRPQHRPAPPGTKAR